ncbi:LrgB family protein [Otariodibacter sp.]|uniref:LrgB family protein n=1 Tax=Otariodibacter sp. TaxID=3030919 RepID=UPI00262ED520|nr:LrgB family protein [Otariodibacter sp.]
MNSPLIYFYSLFTLIVFIISRKLSKRLKISLLNPFILSLIILVVILYLFHIPFKSYYQGNFVVNNLLGVSIVALAVPFYEQLPQLKKHWRKIMIIVGCSTLFTILSGAYFAWLLGANQEILIAMLPKSVTTAIAVSITEELGGDPAITAVAVTIAGIFGSVFGIGILKWIKVTKTHAIGLSLGAVSHALGTARAMDYSIKAGSYASVALVLCGVLTSIIVPFVLHFILKFLY